MLRDKTDRAWFSRLLWHLARKWSRSIPTTLNLTCTPLLTWRTTADYGRSPWKSCWRVSMRNHQVSQSVGHGYPEKYLLKRCESVLYLWKLFKEDLDKPVEECLHIGFIGANNDGGGADNWSYKSCKAPVKSSPPTNQHPAFYSLDALPVAQPTVSEHWREKVQRRKRNKRATS